MFELKPVFRILVYAVQILYRHLEYASSKVSAELSHHLYDQHGDAEAIYLELASYCSSYEDIADPVGYSATLGTETLTWTSINLCHLHIQPYIGLQFGLWRTSEPFPKALIYIWLLPKSSNVNSTHSYNFNILMGRVRNNLNLKLHHCIYLPANNTTMICLFILIH